LRRGVRIDETANIRAVLATQLHEAAARKDFTVWLQSDSLNPPIRARIKCGIRRTIRQKPRDMIAGLATD
jgi:hypothetical protein